MSQISWREWARERGYVMACGDPQIVREIRAELENRKDEGELEGTFYEKNLKGFGYLDGAALPAVKTVLMLAVGRPAHRLVFHTPAGPVAAVIPPTYQDYRRNAERIQEELTRALFGEVYRLALLSAPLKSVAARLGLVKYGRNNITYAPNLGSYCQLVGFLTDAELGSLSAPIAVTGTGLPACRDCQACLKACPTGAIGQDRFLLRAERCLTLFNEFAGPWPDWLPASVHHCLIGCLACQQACPENAGRLRYELIPQSFNVEETGRILAGPADEADPLWSRIQDKLAEVGLPGYESIIRRNLQALVDAR